MGNRVLEKVKKTWPEADPQEIMDVLNEYGTKRHETGRERVQLAILKLSQGKRDRLPDLVKMAKVDWRDALAYAEYPEEMKTGPIKMRELSPQETRAIRQRDKRQYKKWLKG